MPSIKPPPHIIFRLVLAKTLFKSGIELCETKVDIFNFSHGLIALHDALDNFTGAIATHLNISLPQDSKFIATLNLIQDYERKSDQAFIIKSRNELVQLNTIRNNIKHQGIIPDINHTKTLIRPIITFFREYSQRYFNLEWEVISLADLIKEGIIKQSLKEVEYLINIQEYKEALDKMAVIKFQVFDESLLKIKLDSRHGLTPPSEETKKLRASKNIFPGQSDGWFSDLYDRATFLERGIDRDLMDKFEDFTAKVGINNAKEWKYILKHSHNWGELNWRREIAIFCFDFLIDAIVKYQGKDYGVRQKRIIEKHKIRTTDELKLYDKNHDLVYTMPKGEEWYANALSRIDDKWEIYDSNDCFLSLYNVNADKKEVWGFFDEGEENKIEFLETQRFTQDENGNWSLINKTTK